MEAYVHPEHGPCYPQYTYDSSAFLHAAYNPVLDRRNLHTKAGLDATSVMPTEA